MNGCRPLTQKEILRVLNYLRTPRDRALFIVGLYSGFRISELLSLEISDIYRFEQVVDRIRVKASQMKGKEKSREIALHPDARTAIEELLSEIKDKNGPLFRSRNGNRLGRKMAWLILKDAFNQAKLQGKVATHSMRKTFAKNVYVALGENIFKTQKALGHKSLNSTVSYLELDSNEIDSAILSI